MIKDNEYELYELVLRDEEDSVFALSLVSEPAIMQDFIFFNAEGKQVIKFATANEDKHLIVGPILIPDIKILRLKEDGVTPYYVTFTKETVEKIAQKYIKDNNANNITLEHMESVNNVSLVESWIVQSTIYDKSKAYGLTVKPGTWMGVFSLENNKELWNDYVKTGLVKGISLEGLFTHELIKASKVKFDIFEKDIEELTEDEANIVLSKIKQMFESYADYGEGIRNNAKKGIELNEKNNNKCATQTGKVRAQQLANGEAISVETIKRMYSYLSRAETYYDETDMNACGTISYLLWGGKSALSWSKNKLEELGVLEEMAGEKRSFDYHDTLNTERGKELAKKLISEGYDVYVISAAQSTDDMKFILNELGIPMSKVFATGSNSKKVEKVKELGITKHYDNNSDVIKQLGEIGYQFAEPSIVSSYPGESTSGSIAPATFAVEGCPEATQNVGVNLKGRQNAIDTAQYGPLNPNEPNEDYWKAKADQFKGDVETAKKALCGNCSFFVQTKAILDCIANGINDTNAWDTIDAGNLGYCEAFDFKCASNRTCTAWVSGGPITD